MILGFFAANPIAKELTLAAVNANELAPFDVPLLDFGTVAAMHAMTDRVRSPGGASPALLANPETRRALELDALVRKPAAAAMRPRYLN